MRLLSYAAPILSASSRPVYHLPGLCIQLRPVACSVDPSGAALVVELGHLCFREVPKPLQYLILFADDCAREPYQRTAERPYAGFLDVGVQEEAAGAQFGNAQRQRADAGGEAALPVAVAAVRPAPAQLVGLGVHHVVHELLGEAPEQLVHIDGAVVETGHGEHVWRRV